MSHRRDENDMSDRQEPGFEKLLDWVEGRLPEKESASLTEWEKTASAEALAELGWIRSFAKASQNISLQSPPPELRPELETLFDGYAEARQKPGIVRRIMANLSFDSGRQASFGVRSVGSPSGEAQRQLAYETEVADISISIQPVIGGKFDLLGQVLPTGDEDPEDFTVQLVRAGEEVAITDADDLGEFEFRGIGEGTYEFVFVIGNREILTPGFHLSR